MFGQVPPTQFDLRFSVMGIPVRVHPLFWLVGALFGSQALQVPRYGPALLLIWIACLFVSILVHELGHAIAARYFGWPPEIVLYHFGGLAMFQPYHGYTAWRSILVSFAGPLAGFILYGICRGVFHLMLQQGEVPHILVIFAFTQLFWINLWWGLINLLPVLPLDGGRISQEVCQLVNRRRGMEWSIKLGIVISAAVALWFFYQSRQGGGGLYPAFLFGFLCFENVQMLQNYNRGGWY